MSPFSVPLSLKIELDEAYGCHYFKAARISVQFFNTDPYLGSGNGIFLTLDLGTDTKIPDPQHCTQSKSFTTH